jgi:putative transposase
MSLRTIVLKLHKPGRSKSRILDEALLNYTQGFIITCLPKPRLNWLQYGTSMATAGNLPCRNAVKVGGRDLGKELNRFDVQPFKDSLKMEVGMVLASYLGLEAIRAKVTFPKACDFTNPENIR